jgi:putative nucleotidyltransferase with HDIG domain
MSTVVLTHRLGGRIYQPRDSPPASASAVTALTRPVNLTIKRMRSVPSAGSVDRAVIVSPVWGRFKQISHPSGVQDSQLIYGLALALLVAASGLMAFLLVLDFASSAPLWVLAALGATAALAERQGVRVDSHTHTSVSVLPVLLAAVVFGPIDAMTVAFCALLPYFRAPLLRWSIWTCSRVLVAGVAGLIASGFLASEVTLPAILVAVTLASLAEGLGDALLTSVTVEVRHRGAFRPTFGTLLRVLALTGPLHVPVVAGLAYAYLTLPPWSILLFAVPAFAAHYLLRLYQEQATLAADLLVASGRMEQANLSFAAALVAALDARDTYTAGHSAAVAVYARDIATAMGLGEADRKRAHLAGLLHDIGKVGLPAGILEKAGPLTGVERQEMQAHSAIGERILRNVEGYADIAHIVRHHHERIDGAGYPDSLPGHSIPLLSRVIAVADAYNAMTSGRPYRQASTPEDARARLRAAAGTQFDTHVVAAFEELLSSSTETYCRGARADFAVEAQWAESQGARLQLAAA